MTTIRSIRNLFTTGITVFLIFLVLMEAVPWITAGEDRLTFVNKNGGGFAYASLFIKNLLLPEIMTVFVLSMLINWTRRWIKIELADLTWKALIRYQLSYLPVFLVAFVLFIPITQSVRYLLVEFPAYSFYTYWNTYILDSYSLPIYFRYLVPVLLIGYSILNVSLATGFLRNRQLVVR